MGALVPTLLLLAGLVVGGAAPAAATQSFGAVDPGRPTIWVDGSDRTHAAWIEQESSDPLAHSRIVITRSVAGGEALDPSFATAGRRNVTLTNPWAWPDGVFAGTVGRMVELGFASDGTLSAAWLGTAATDTHAGDAIAIDTYSVAGTRLSRHVLAAPANTYCNDSKGDGCGDVNVIEAYFSALDNGTMILGTDRNYSGAGTSTIYGWNASTGAALGTVALPANRQRALGSSLGSSGAVVNTFDWNGTSTVTGPTYLIADWGAPTTLANSNFCNWWGAPSGLLHTCPTAVVTLADAAGATQWQRTVPNAVGTAAASVSADGHVTFVTVDGDREVIIGLTSSGTIQRVDVGALSTPSFVREAAIPRRLASGALVTLIVRQSSVDLSAGTGVVVTVPAKPAAPVATPKDTAAHLTWSAPGDGGSPITGYRITPYEAGVAQAGITVGNVTSFDVTGLVDCSSYTFTVAAINAKGTGPASDPSNIVVPAMLPPAPTGVTATAGHNNATVRWTAAVPRCSSPITGYKVKLTADGVDLLLITVGNVTSTVVPNLTPGKLYTFTVSAVSEIGTGPESAEAGPVTPPPAGFSSWSSLVARQYIDLTGTSPTAGQSSSWTVPLQKGTKLPGDLPAALRLGADNTTNVDPTTRLYQAYFVRIPDRSGLTYWVKKRRAGTALSAVSNAFAKSSEFVRRYGSLTNREFVELVYQNVLGRPGEASGVDYWTAKLDSGAKSRGQVMVGFSESSENVRVQKDRVTVEVFYVFLLGRSPTPSEVDDAVAQLVGGTTVSELAQQILTSAEYADRIAAL
jgi:hypothetical protein